MASPITGIAASIDISERKGFDLPDPLERLALSDILVNITIPDRSSIPVIDLGMDSDRSSSGIDDPADDFELKPCWIRLSDFVRGGSGGATIGELAPEDLERASFTVSGPAGEIILKEKKIDMVPTPPASPVSFPEIITQNPPPDDSVSISQAVATHICPVEAVITNSEITTTLPDVNIKDVSLSVDTNPEPVKTVSLGIAVSKNKSRERKKEVAREIIKSSYFDIWDTVSNLMSVQDRSLSKNRFHSSKMSKYLSLFGYDLAKQYELSYQSKLPSKPGFRPTLRHLYKNVKRCNRAHQIRCRFRCHECRFSTESRIICDDHRRKPHLVTDTVMDENFTLITTASLRCPYCRYKTRKSHFMRDHLERSHGIPQSCVPLFEPSPRLYSCILCFYEVDKEINWVNHVKKCKARYDPKTFLSLSRMYVAYYPIPVMDIMPIPQVPSTAVPPSISCSKPILAITSYDKPNITTTILNRPFPQIRWDPDRPFQKTFPPSAPSTARTMASILTPRITYVTLPPLTNHVTTTTTMAASIEPETKTDYQLKHYMPTPTNYFGENDLTVSAPKPAVPGDSRQLLDKYMSMLKSLRFERPDIPNLPSTTIGVLSRDALSKTTAVTSVPPRPVFRTNPTSHPPPTFSGPTSVALKLGSVPNFRISGGKLSEEAKKELVKSLTSTLGNIQARKASHTLSYLPNVPSSTPDKMNAVGAMVQFSPSRRPTPRAEGYSLGGGGPPKSTATNTLSYLPKPSSSTTHHKMNANAPTVSSCPLSKPAPRAEGYPNGGVESTSTTIHTITSLPNVSSSVTTSEIDTTAPATSNSPIPTLAHCAEGDGSGARSVSVSCSSSPPQITANKERQPGPNDPITSSTPETCNTSTTTTTTITTSTKNKRNDSLGSLGSLVSAISKFYEESLPKGKAKIFRTTSPTPAPSYDPRYRYPRRITPTDDIGYVDAPISTHQQLLRSITGLADLVGRVGNRESTKTKEAQIIDSQAKVIPEIDGAEERENSDAETTPDSSSDPDWHSRIGEVTTVTKVPHPRQCVTKRKHGDYVDSEESDGDVAIVGEVKVGTEPISSTKRISREDCSGSKMADAPVSSTRDTPLRVAEEEYVENVEDDGNRRREETCCEICDETFPDPEFSEEYDSIDKVHNLIVAHYATRHSVRICPKPSSTTSSSISPKKGTKILPIPPMNCRKCYTRYFTLNGLERHLSRQHNLIMPDIAGIMSRSSRGPKFCIWCSDITEPQKGDPGSAGVAIVTDMVRHLSEAHGIDLRIRGAPRYVCHRCSTGEPFFECYETLVKHTLQTHGVSLAPQPPSSSITTTTNTTTANRDTLVRSGKRKPISNMATVDAKRQVIPDPPFSVRPKLAKSYTSTNAAGALSYFSNVNLERQLPELVPTAPAPAPPRIESTDRLTKKEVTLHLRCELCLDLSRPSEQFIGPGAFVHHVLTKHAPMIEPGLTSILRETVLPVNVTNRPSHRHEKRDGSDTFESSFFKTQIPLAIWAMYQKCSPFATATFIEKSKDPLISINNNKFDNQNSAHNLGVGSQMTIRPPSNMIGARSFFNGNCDNSEVHMFTDFNKNLNRHSYNKVGSYPNLTTITPLTDTHPPPLKSIYSTPTTTRSDMTYQVFDTLS